MNRQIIKTAVTTIFALLAFAGNSILCRLALKGDMIDAASFTAIRLLSGIIILLAMLIITPQKTGRAVSKGSWFGAAMLFLYAAAFSFAYISLDTGTGALILFGAVQISMIVISVIGGNRLHYSEWAGVALAFAGFIYLVGSDLAAPSIAGFILMTTAGIAWGIYTLKGRTSPDPVGDTTYNFLRTLPLIVILMLATFSTARLSPEGIALAVLSGAVASGIGYAAWYIALGGLSVSKAAVIQLLVPVIAATGGVIFAGEIISLRLMLASLMVLGGIVMVLWGKYYFARPTLNEE